MLRPDHRVPLRGVKLGATSTTNNTDTFKVRARDPTDVKDETVSVQKSEVEQAGRWRPWGGRCASGGKCHTGECPERGMIYTCTEGEAVAPHGSRLTAHAYVNTLADELSALTSFIFNVSFLILLLKNKY